MDISWNHTMESFTCHKGNIDFVARSFFFRGARKMHYSTIRSHILLVLLCSTFNFIPSVNSWFATT